MAGGKHGHAHDTGQQGAAARTRVDFERGGGMGPEVALLAKGMPCTGAHRRARKRSTASHPISKEFATALTNSINVFVNLVLVTEPDPSRRKTRSTGCWQPCGALVSTSRHACTVGHHAGRSRKGQEVVSARHPRGTDYLVVGERVASFQRVRIVFSILRVADCTWIIAVVPIWRGPFGGVARARAPWDMCAVAALETLEAEGALAVLVALANTWLQGLGIVVIASGKFDWAWRQT